MESNSSGQFRRRLLNGMGANAFGQAVTIATQLGTLPIFLTYWSPAEYGRWLILTAVPSYISISDFGILAVSINRMTIAVGRQDVQEANRIFSAALQFFLGVSIVLIAATWFVLEAFTIDGIQSTEARLTVLTLAATTLLTLAQGLPEACLRATNQYATAVFLSNFSRLFEWAGYIVGLILFQDMLSVAVSGLIPRSIIFFASSYYAKSRSVITWRIDLSDLIELKVMLIPAAGYLIFPLSMAISIQGVTLAIAGALGTEAVVAFTAYRTISRLTLQITGIFSHALAPEFSALYGRGGIPATLDIFRRARLYSAAPAIIITPLVFAISPYVLYIWSRGRIPFETTTFLYLMLSSLAGSLSHVPRIFLLSLNLHIRLALATLVLSAATTIAVYFSANAHGMQGAAIAILIGEILLFVVSHILASRTTRV